MPLAAVAGISAGTSLLGGLFGSNAADKAADAQTQAANHAADLQYQSSQNALDFQKQQYNQQQQNLQPWLQTGENSLANLAYLAGIGPNTSATSTPANFAGGVPIISGRGGVLSPSTPSSAVPGGLVNPTTGTPATGSGVGIGTFPATNTATGAYGSLLTPYGKTFQAPTEAQFEANDPGLQARLKLGTDAIQRSAAARGGVVTGGTAEALNQYAQDYGSNEYNNAYNRALNTFNSNYNQYNTDQANQYNKLASLAGVGQTAANTLGSEGQAASNNVSSNLLNTGAQIGQDYQNAGNATASGYVGSANAINGALGGASNNLTQLAMLNQIYGGGGASIPTLNTSGGLGMTGGNYPMTSSPPTVDMSGFPTAYTMGAY